MTVLDRKLITRMVNPQPGGNGGGAGGAGGAGVYVLPAASSSELGGIKLGYPTGTGKYYPVQLDDQQRAYVNVTWTTPVQSDWNEASSTSLAYIKNKPSLDYLSLTGGTMTGGITCAQNKYASSNEFGIDMNNSDIIGCNAIRFGDTSDDYTEAVMFKRTNDNYDSFRALDGTFYFGANNGTEKDAANIGSASANLSYIYTNQLHPGNSNNLWLNTSTNNHIIANGPLIIPISNDVDLANYGRYALAIGGDPRNNESHIGIDNNEIMAKGSASTTATLYLNAEGGTVCINEEAGNCGIGTNAPSYKLHVAGKIYCTGGFAFLSDIRKKNVVGFCNGFSVKDIANAPLIQYTLKGDLDDGRRHIGSVAQYWQKVLPDTVNEADDTLSMDQESILMASVITLARKVMSLENQIIQLKVKGYGKQ